MEFWKQMKTKKSQLYWKNLHPQIQHQDKPAHVSMFSLNTRYRL
ncbi:hypothetical protein AB205_0144510 [Aquarana catesbeiana]|uniref:Uncharacterized protein n=1 Tax=Aquarana catesbeiana TaxID=8400 RepID=A0A2G9S9Q2_AQUCT|nr:hypothetical protein AB205_0144510 [Aquarana catesbeiana]